MIRSHTLSVPLELGNTNLGFFYWRDNLLTLTWKLTGMGWLGLKLETTGEREDTVEDGFWPITVKD